MEFYGTIGPACAQLETLQRMVKAGMTGIRMNLSHGPLSAHKDWLDIIHAVGIPQLLIDLQGPELRIGTLTSPLSWNRARASGWGKGVSPARRRWCMQPGRARTFCWTTAGSLCRWPKPMALPCSVLWYGAAPCKAAKALRHRG